MLNKTNPLRMINGLERKNGCFLVPPIKWHHGTADLLDGWSYTSLLTTPCYVRNCTTIDLTKLPSVQDRIKRSSKITFYCNSFSHHQRLRALSRFTTPEIVDKHQGPYTRSVTWPPNEIHTKQELRSVRRK